METLLTSCTVCFGDPESTLTKGLSWAIITLLIILAGIFVLFIRFIFKFRKRSRLMKDI
jgi:Na+/proline symporter